jgi:hypothetical protein
MAQAMHRTLRGRSEPFVVENQDGGMLAGEHFRDFVLVDCFADDYELVPRVESV